MSFQAAFQLERHWAAQLLRAARRAARRHDHERASELLDWALLLMPDSPAAERLRIDILLREHHLDSAQTMIARRLLGRPNDPLLLLLRARCFHRRGDLLRADADLSRLRVMAPARRDALELAAEIASRLGDHARAVDLYARLLAQNPEDERVLTLLSRALIDSAEPEKALHAERLLLRLDCPPPVLLARSYMVQGRYREAVDCLESPVNTSAFRAAAEDDDSVLALYATALELCGDVSRIDSLLARIEPRAFPMAALALSRIMLAQGRFQPAAFLGLHILRTSPGAHHDAAVPIAAVAAALAGRKRLARRAMSHLNGSRPQRPIVSREWADCWRRGLRGRILHEQRRACTPSSGGGDPSPSVLRSLLRSAVSVHEARLHERRGSAEGALAHLESDLAVCRAALAG